MNQSFKGWPEVSVRLRASAEKQDQIAEKKGDLSCWLNHGQRASLRAIADRISRNGIVIADEVGMGKTRIAVELVRCVTESGGRVAIIVPPGLGYQWHAELLGGKVEAPMIMRSLWQYLSAWEPSKEEDQAPWFRHNVVVMSHAFTNWRLSATSDCWRWALLPELYAEWRRLNGRLPWGYRGKRELNDSRVKNAAKSICKAVPGDHHPTFQILNDLVGKTPWPGALEGTEYGRNNSLRPWLERAVGLGLGLFDLVIIDEAHKSRGGESGLSRLLDKVILSAPAGRRLAMTATPVELDVSQWQQTLNRICIDINVLSPLSQAIEDYAVAVKKVRQCPSNQSSVANFKLASKTFQNVLSPFLIRRDKREDPDVLRFKETSGLSVNEYRRESEIAVETPREPGLAWEQAVCAAESLAVVARQADDPAAKRLRLTLGNGHGISTLIDQTQEEPSDNHSVDSEQFPEKVPRNIPTPYEIKRTARVSWWLGVLKSPFMIGEEVLFDHPAILSAVKDIESFTAQGEKVLVFGRFTRPMRALVELLNAREMLRHLEDDRLWPQAKVHGAPSEDLVYSEWPGLRAAHRQLKSSLVLSDIDLVLGTQYKKLENLRATFRRNLLAKIEEGMVGSDCDSKFWCLFVAFKMSVLNVAAEESDLHPLTLVSKALHELLGHPLEPPSSYECADAFVQLIGALCDQGEGDTDGDGKLSEKEASKFWPVLEERLREEYSTTRGGFARLMYGGTVSESRRMIQLAFNRPNSFPKVLVAQSMVGREGLNLHKACRIVLLLHPEWNPGVVEQQIGRVDRVGSHWAKQLLKAVEDSVPVEDLPRIEIRPVIFKGTYDEYNWTVLRERWDTLRAQLHGVIIPPRQATSAQLDQSLIDDITEASPNFSPVKFM